MLAFRAALLLAVLGLARGFSAGAPTQACGDMVPQHHVAPQNSASPYGVRAAKHAKNARQLVLSISGQEPFKGFMAQCRVGNVPVGRFINPPAGVKLVDCGSSKASAATHSSSAEKNDISLTWEAPPNLTEKVTCLATVAKNGGVFWVGVPANTLTF